MGVKILQLRNIYTKISYINYILALWILNFIHLFFIKNSIINNNTYLAWISGAKISDALDENVASTPFVDSGQGLNIFNYNIGAYKDTFLAIDFANFFIHGIGINSIFISKIIYIILMILVISPSLIYFKKIISVHFKLANTIIILLFLKQLFLNSYKIGIGFIWPFSDFGSLSFFHEVKNIFGLLFVGTPSIQFIGQDPRNITIFIICISFLLLYYRPGINLFIIMFPIFYVDFYMAIFGYMLLICIQCTYLFIMGVKFLDRKFVVTILVNILILFSLWISFSILEGVLKLILAVLSYFTFIHFKEYFIDNKIYSFNYLKFRKSVFLIIVLFLILFSALTLSVSIYENNLFIGQYLTSVLSFESLPRSLFIFGYFIQILFLLRLKNLILKSFFVLNNLFFRRLNKNSFES